MVLLSFCHWFMPLVGWLKSEGICDSVHETGGQLTLGSGPFGRLGSDAGGVGLGA